jgi:predicted dehydrogenase
LAATQDIAFAVIGLNHGHIYMQVECMLGAGATLVSFYAKEDELAAAFSVNYPAARRVSDPRAIYEDPHIRLVLTAAIPNERAGIAVTSMRHGKDVMTDKPGATTLGQLEELKKAQAETGRICSIYYEGRLESRATTLACDLVAKGAIGRFVHLTSLAPHAMRRTERAEWFFRSERAGGIIADLATHSCDQFLVLAGTLDADVTFASADNRANPDVSDFCDFGELCLSARDCSAYVRVDWLTPTGLPVYGDGRLFIVGTEGAIEVRECIDLGQTPRQAVFLIDRSGVRDLDLNGTTLLYGQRLVSDILNRTEISMSQAHCFKATELALQAQQRAQSRREAGDRFAGIGSKSSPSYFA